MHELVAYGFASWDDVGAMVAAGELEVDGLLPANTAGGLLSEGHLSGFGHVAEAVRQVRGTSPCQVPDVQLSMVTGYGGAPHESPPTVAYTVAVAAWRMTTRDVVVDGIRLHVTEAGRGPALLMLHGLSATHANWEHTIAAFSSASA